MAHSKALLSMSGIGKAFPGVQALDDVDFDLREGEIHALVGENGAGKSTLIKVLTGVDRPDSGSILLDDRETVVHSPTEAQALGISTVYQEVNLCPNLSVAENILIGHEPHRLGRIHWAALNARAERILADLELSIDVSEPLGSYPVAIQQMAAIARSLVIEGARILILDEPTSSLDARETDQLFEVMRKLRSEGRSIVFVSHFLDQVYEISDRITVLRNGRLVGTYETATLPRMQLIARMLGRELTELDEMKRIKLEASEHPTGAMRLSAAGLGREGSMEPFDLDLRAGEVVGLAGLLGSGRTEVAALLFGIDKPDQGTLAVAGKPVANHSPLGSIGRRVALCPEDRKVEGIVDDLTVRENIILAVQAGRGWLRALSRARQEEIADRYIGLLRIATPTAEQLVRNLSGGNQQKVILARWLATSPQVLILDEPTRGIDIGAKAEVQRLVLDLASEGMACVFISSELDEVLRTSHRIVVLRDRVKVTEFEGEVDEHRLMVAIGGSEDDAA